MSYHPPLKQTSTTYILPGSNSLKLAALALSACSPYSLYPESPDYPPRSPTTSSSPSSHTLFCKEAKGQGSLRRQLQTVCYLLSQRPLQLTLISPSMNRAMRTAQQEHTPCSSCWRGLGVLHQGHATG